MRKLTKKAKKREEEEEEKRIPLDGIKKDLLKKFLRVKSSKPLLACFVVE